MDHCSSGPGEAGKKSSQVVQLTLNNFEECRVVDRQAGDKQVPEDAGLGQLR